MAHGALGLLQYQVLGFVLAFPTFMVLLERSSRFWLGFHKVPASLQVLNEGAACITATIPNFYLWSYRAASSHHVLRHH